MYKGKTVLVTGSTSGIGYAIATCFAKKQANLILNGFGDPQAIEQAIKELENLTKGVVLHYPADLTKVEEIEAMIQTVEAQFGGIDILVNNAGIQYVAPIDAFPVEKWDLVLSLNLTAYFHTIRLAIPQMKKQKSGRIINIASAHGLVASPNKSAYVAAKHGVLGLTKTVALEIAEDGITCNAICPGWVKTPLVEAQIKKNALEAGSSIETATLKLVSDKHPTKQFVEPSSIGELCLFLASPSASQMTGASLSLDGGWTAT